MARRIHPIRPDATTLLRQSIANIERGGFRPSANEDAMLDAIAAGMTTILHEKLSLLETCIAKLEAQLIAMRDRR